MLTKPWARGLTILLAGVVLGCGNDSNGTGPDLADLAGTYTATKFEFTSVASASTTFDLVSDGGATFDLTIEADGDYTLTGHFPGFPDEVDLGTINIDGNDITLDGIDPVTGTFTLTSSTLTINIPTGTEFDFDDDGTDEPARLQMVFQRT